MIAIFAVIIWKLDVAQKIENLRNSIQKKVEDSDLLKNQAVDNYEKIKKSLGNIEAEISSIIAKAEDTAKSFEVRTKTELDKSITLIKQNAEKQVQTEQNRTQNQLFKTVSVASVNIAKKQIVSALENDKNLHRKYIEEFINNIDNLDV